MARTKMSVTHTAVSIQSWSRRWPSISTLCMFLDGKHRQRPHQPMSLAQILQITLMFVVETRIRVNLALTFSDNGAKQSRPSFHGTIVPRPQATRRTPNHPQSRPREGRKHGLSAPNRRRCRYRPWRSHGHHEAHKAVHREGRCRNPHRRPSTRNKEVRTHGRQSACPDQRAHQPPSSHPRSGRHHGHRSPRRCQNRFRSRHSYHLHHRPTRPLLHPGLHEPRSPAPQ